MAADRPAVPLHDWTRVSAGKWHDMHLAWTGALRTELNEGALPDPFFALAEPVTGFRITSDGEEGPLLPEHWRREPDMLAAVGRSATADHAAGNGTAHFAKPSVGVAAAEAPSRFALFERITRANVRRRVTVRHPDGDRVVAIVEFASPGNRDAFPKVFHFARTVAAALEAGVHCVLIEPFPPTTAAPRRAARGGHDRTGRRPRPRSGPPADVRRVLRDRVPRRVRRRRRAPRGRRAGPDGPAVPRPGLVPAARSGPELRGGVPRVPEAGAGGATIGGLMFHPGGPPVREFTVIVERDAEGWYVGSVPALPGCHTQAKSRDELTVQVREAIALCLEERADQATDETTDAAEFVGVQRIAVAA